MTELYMCVMGDIVGSRKLEAREETQDALRRCLRELNQRFESAVVADFAIDRGDAFQGLVAAPTRFDALFWAFQASWWTGPRGGRVPAVRWSFAVGPISTPIRRRAVVEMDGACFHLAREGMDGEKEGGRPASWALDGRPEESDAYARLGAALVQQVQDWTAPQRETVGYHRMSGGSAEETARSPGDAPGGVRGPRQGEIRPRRGRARRARRLVRRGLERPNKSFEFSINI